MFKVVRRLLSLFAICGLMSIQGCSLTPGPEGYSNSQIGFGGAVAGASAGAIIGSLIKNGDILKSAGFGAAIGLPAGLALNLLMNSFEPSKPERIDQANIIKENQDRLFRQEREIEELRQQVEREIPESRVGNYGNPYVGPTTGNPFR